MAQDRGRLEAKIEALCAELDTQKRQNERDSDALKIKAKIVDDQTESIRKLKEVAGVVFDGTTRSSQVSDVIVDTPFFLSSGSLPSKGLAGA